ncbi:MAG: Na(+)-translocating NADH-quinone reductase subunit A [Candidatus Aminicenantes bacterium]|nr:Na(+)-translocating NADH-quinone reductase subunit A [Candidatus Aminicenantes bacterium]
MGLTKIKKGLDIPITGEPKQEISAAAAPKRVALVGYDYMGMKPTMAVSIGDKVKLGQLLFTDKKMPGVKYTSPGAGKVVEINRGAKRVFESIVIELQGNREITFDSFPGDKLESADKEKIKNQLIESGMWTALRERPFGKTADPAHTPHSIFVNAMDSNPLAPAVDKVLEGSEKAFRDGLTLLSKLTPGKLFLCKAPGSNIPTAGIDSLSVEEFSGPHPAGIPGTHIHFLDPVYREKCVWYIGAQDVAAFGKFFAAGKIPVERVVSLAGPTVKHPRLLRTRIGACIDDISGSEIEDGDNRVLSGSILNGRTAENSLSYLGRYHRQITSLREDRKREFLGWLSPGWNSFSVKKILASSLFPWKKFAFSTSTEGGPRPIVPVGSYEKVMPLDILPTFLLRSLMVDDVEEVEKLGVLELVEEDLALCTFVSAAKIDCGEALRRNLTIIEKEG